MTSSENSETPLSHSDFHGHKITHPDSPLYRMVLDEVFSGEAYPLDWLGAFVPTVIFDVGANIGTTAIYFHHHCPQATIHCYEPDPFNLQLLEQNTYGIDQITIHPFGLHLKNDQMPLYQGPHGTAENTLFSDAPAPFQVVPVRRASEAVAETGVPQISILKIDVEGAESLILLDLFSSGNLPIPIGAILIEHHADHQKKWIDQYLAEFYQVFPIQSPMPHRGTRLYVLKQLLPIIRPPQTT